MPPKKCYKLNVNRSNKDEQMIYNNYLAMRFIQDHSNDDLTPTLVCELHKIVTEKYARQ